MSDNFDNVLKCVIQGAAKQWADIRRDCSPLSPSAPDAYQAYAAAHGLHPEDLTDAQRKEAFTAAVLAMNRQETP